MKKIFATFDTSTIMRIGITPEPGRPARQMWVSHNNDYDEHSFNEEFNQSGLYSTVPFDEIPGNTCYNVYIRLQAQPKTVSPVQLVKEINDQLIEHPQYQTLIEHSKQGRVTWWIDQQREMLITLQSSSNRHWLTLCDRVGTNQVHYIVGGVPCAASKDFERETGIRLHYANPYERIVKKLWNTDNYSDFINKIVTDTNSGKELGFRALTYSRLSRPHRALMFAYLEKHNYLRNTLYSWGGLDSFYHYPNRNTIVQECISGTKFLCKQVDSDLGNRAAEWIKKPAQVIGDELMGVDLRRNQGVNINLLHPTMCNFQIVTETMAAGGVMVTEKLIKPAMQGMPFVVLGHAGLIKAMQDRGYRTFDRWINHEYDQHEDFTTRWKLFSDELTRLYSLSSQEWADMREAMLPDIIYNLYHIKHRANIDYGYIFHEDR